MSKNTKDSILDEAEVLFAEQGIGATSLRMITAAAGTNLASVNYHFGSKDALVEAVFERRLKPMNHERLQRLQQLQRSGRVVLEDLIEAFVGPALDLSRQTRGGATFIKLLGQTYTKPSSQLHDYLRNMYEEVIQCFKPAMAEALPQIAKQELYWRLHFMVGTLAYCMAGTDLMRLISSSDMQHSLNTQELTRRLVAFLSAGLRAEVMQEDVNHVTQPVFG